MMNKRIICYCNVLHVTVYFSELCFIDLDSCDLSAVPNASFLQNFKKTDLGTDLINIQRNTGFLDFWVGFGSGKSYPRNGKR